MLINFSIKDNGICLDSCKYIDNIKRGSYACELCRYFFGYENDKIRCAGDRILNEGV